MNADYVIALICAAVATAAFLTAAGIWMDKKIWADMDPPKESK